MSAMPIRAELRDERGNAIRGLDDPSGGTFDAAGDFDRLLAAGSPTCRLLHYVDPYGDTMFNSVQMSDVLDDIERLGQQELKPTERRGLDRLRAMCHRCRDSVHLYVWFIGD